MHRRHEHVLFDPVQHLVVDQRRRAIGAHAAGVRTGVAVVGPLVILRRRQRDDRPAVGDRQHAGFLAVEPLFDHDLVAGVAEFAVAADAFDRFDRFGPRGADKHSLARRQAVGLDDHRHVFAILRNVVAWSALRNT